MIIFLCDNTVEPYIFAMFLLTNCWFFFWSEKLAAIFKQFWLSLHVSESSVSYLKQKAVEDLYGQVNFRKEIFKKLNIKNKFQQKKTVRCIEMFSFTA